MAIESVGLAVDSLFKKKYGKYLSRIPTFAILRDKIGFDVSKRIGEDYNEQIELELEHGFTKDTGFADGFSLDAPIAGASKRATIQSSVGVLRTGLGIRGLMASTGGPDEVAFRELTKNRVRSMWKSSNKRLELDLLYGQCSDTGNVGSGGLGVLSVDPGATAVLTFTAASWAPAIWAGMKDALIHIFAPADPPTVKRTDTGATPTGYLSELVSQISKVDAVARTLTLTAVVDAAVTTGDIVFLRGSRTTTAWKEMIGLHRYSSQITGTLLGIDTTVYDQWAPFTKDAGGAVLSFDLIQDVLMNLIGKGLEGNVTVLTSPFQWGKMMNDLGGLRRIDYSQNSNKYVVGASEIEFYSANGKVTIIAHPYVKTGFAYITTIDNDDSYRMSDNDEGDSNMGALSRGGITDVTFNRPSGLVREAQTTPKFFYETNNEYTVELRCVYDEFLMCNAVGHQAMIFNLATA